MYEGSVAVGSRLSMDYQWMSVWRLYIRMGRYADLIASLRISEGIEGS